MKEPGSIRDLWIKQSRIWRQRFLLKHIKRGASDDFVFQRMRECDFVDYWSARTVDQIGGRFHQLKRLLIDQVISRLVAFALAQEWHVDTDIIRAAYRFLKLDIFDPGLFFLNPARVPQIHHLLNRGDEGIVMIRRVVTE